MEDEGTIREVTDRKEYLKVETFKELTFYFYERPGQSCPVCSSSEQGFGLNWQLSFENEDKTANRFDLIVKCNEGSFSSIWEISCSFELELIGTISREAVRFEKKFNSINNSMTISDFLEFNQSELPFTNLMLKLRITIKELIGVSKSYEFDFENEYEVISDATLVAFDEEENRERKLYVSKAVGKYSLIYLSLYSPVFRDMFLKLEHEKKPAEIKMDASYSSLVVLLNLIYPSHSLPAFMNSEYYLDSEDFSTLFHIAETFKIDFVKRKLEEFLIEDIPVSIFCKFHFAEKYELDMLMNKCLLEIESVDDARRVVEEERDPEEGCLSIKTKAAIFGRLMSLPPTSRARLIVNNDDSEND